MNATPPTDESLHTAVLPALAVYLRPRVLIILLLGFSSGLPLALSGETLRVWMADRGVDLGTIGLLTLAGLPYTLKFLWAPVVDAWDVPFLSRRLGRRRGWMVASQLLLMGTIAFLGTRDPLSAPLMVGFAALLVAFASATQDIVVDAFRVQSLPTDEQAAGMASYVAAYRVGMLASGAGVIGLSAWLETQGLSKEAIWPIAYAGAALLVLIGLAAALLAREPASAVDDMAAIRPEPLKRLSDTAKGAFLEFFKRDAALSILMLVVLFKLCDALAGAMTAPFVLSLGYTKAEYAAIVKGVGLAALLAGGAVARALPMLKPSGSARSFRCSPTWCSCGLDRKRRALGP
jgi:PAT family beta-lactamase induction signal transducer AmpG